MKIKELQEELVKKKVDVALFYNLDYLVHNSNLFYFSGYRGTGMLVVPALKNPFLIVPKMEYTPIMAHKIKRYTLAKGRLFETALTRIKKVGISAKRIGIDKESFSIRYYNRFKKVFRKAKIFDVAKICHELRKTKTDREIGIIKKACLITDRIIMNCIDNFQKFRTEFDVKKFLHIETIKADCELSFNPIVASGRDSSYVHYNGNKKLRKGFCIIDFGIRYRGYCTDITRTIHIGTPSHKEREAYNRVLKLQEDIIRNIDEGTKCKDLYNIAKKVLGRYFTHGLGHGLGVDVHELPGLTSDSKESLQNNNVVTVEPGVYYPGRFGIRIEDDILVTRGGAVQLTKTDKALEVV